jgi:hypothetical protein
VPGRLFRRAARDLYGHGAGVLRLGCAAGAGSRDPTICVVRGVAGPILRVRRHRHSDGNNHRCHGSPGIQRRVRNGGCYERVGS